MNWGCEVVGAVMSPWPSRGCPLLSWWSNAARAVWSGATQSNGNRRMSLAGFSSCRCGDLWTFEASCRAFCSGPSDVVCRLPAFAPALATMHLPPSLACLLACLPARLLACYSYRCYLGIVNHKETGRKISTSLRCLVLVQIRPWNRRRDLLACRGPRPNWVLMSA
jgi:hypothetical protein